MDQASWRWLFLVGLHGGTHRRGLRKVARRSTLKGPRLVYRDGEFLRIDGSILWEPKRDYSPETAFDFYMAVLKGYLAGPLIVKMLTGEQADPEPDILNACECVEMSRKEVDLWLVIAESELREELRNPVIFGEILDAARKYADTIFGHDFCIDWGIEKFGLSERMKSEANS